MRPTWNIGFRNLTSLILFLTASLALLFLPTESRPSRTPGDDFVRFSKPEFLGFDELVEAEQKDPLPPELAKKLEILVTTPIISNEAYYEGAKPKHPSSPELGPYLRAILWNIERGIQFDPIRIALSEPEKFDQVKVLKQQHLHLSYEGHNGFFSKSRRNHGFQHQARIRRSHFFMSFVPSPAVSSTSTSGLPTDPDG
jgi:hypothetical protein